MTRRTPGMGSSTTSGASVEIFVEGNVVAHASVIRLREPAYHYFGHRCTSWQLC